MCEHVGRAHYFVRQGPCPPNSVSSTPQLRLGQPKECKLPAALLPNVQRRCSPYTNYNAVPLRPHRQTDPDARPGRSPTRPLLMSTTHNRTNRGVLFDGRADTAVRTRARPAPFSATAAEPAARTRLGPPTPRSDSPWTTPLQRTPHMGFVRRLRLCWLRLVPRRAPMVSFVSRSDPGQTV